MLLRPWPRLGRVGGGTISCATANPADLNLESARPDHLSLSYNGGKDCLVLLVLILACLPGWAARPPPPASDIAAADALAAATSDSPPPSTAVAPGRPLQAIYIVSNHPFAEVEEFVEQSAQQYHIDLKRYALPMRPALEAYLEDRPAVKAVFLGTRRTDPHGEFLTHFDPTDEGWPQFMRVHPVIDWHYVEIWAVSLGLCRTANWPKGSGADSEAVHSAPPYPVLRLVQQGIYVLGRCNRHPSESRAGSERGHIEISSSV